jgi:hypothetical protein
MTIPLLETVNGQGFPACVTVSGRPSNVSTALLGDMSMFGWTLPNEIAMGPGAANGVTKPSHDGIGGLLKLH